jgi:hypothetical protein
VPSAARFASERHPSSLSNVQAVERNPCGVTSFRSKPNDRKAPLRAAPCRGRDGLRSKGKTYSLSPGKCAQLQKKFECLSGEWQQMLDSRLHAIGRDSPVRRLQIKSPPARLAQLPWPHKEEEGEAQGDADDLAAHVSVHRAQQFS